MDERIKLQENQMKKKNKHMRLIFLFLLTTLTLIKCSKIDSLRFNSINDITKKHINGYKLVPYAIEPILLESSDTLLLEDFEFFNAGRRLIQLNKELNILHLAYKNSEDIGGDSIIIKNSRFSIDDIYNRAYFNCNGQYLNSKHRSKFYISKIYKIHRDKIEYIIVNAIPFEYSSSYFANNIEINMIFDNKSETLLFCCLNPKNNSNILFTELNDDLSDVELVFWNPTLDTLKCVSFYENEKWPHMLNQFLIIKTVLKADSINFSIELKSSNWFQNKDIIPSSSSMFDSIPVNSENYLNNF